MLMPKPGGALAPSPSRHHRPWPRWRGPPGIARRRPPPGPRCSSSARCPSTERSSSRVTERHRASVTWPCTRIVVVGHLQRVARQDDLGHFRDAGVVEAQLTRRPSAGRVGCPACAAGAAAVCAPNCRRPDRSRTCAPRPCLPRRSACPPAGALAQIGGAQLIDQAGAGRLAQPVATMPSDSATRKQRNAETLLRERVAPMPVMSAHFPRLTRTDGHQRHRRGTWSAALRTHRRIRAPPITRQVGAAVNFVGRRSTVNIIALAAGNVSVCRDAPSQRDGSTGVAWSRAAGRAFCWSGAWSPR